jgi:uncharacterized membrane protein YukC
MIIYFIGVVTSIFLTRLVYVNYLESIGLEYNPNKATKIFGQEIKPYYNMLNVIDEYIETKNLNVRQIKYLRAIKKWEFLNWIALGLFPIVVIVSFYLTGQ